MTDKQRLALLNSAIRELKATKQGYDPKGPHWKAAMEDLHDLALSLAPSKIVIGPVFRTGKSVLDHDLTHPSGGIPLYPAFDDAFTQGTVIIAPEDMTVDNKPSSSSPGHAFYTTGKSKIRYWFGHLDRDHPLGTKFKRGDAIGKVAANNIGGGPHVHVGINVELLLGKGKELKHHTDYTHGAPTIREQLGKVLV